jgi:hypothetical protein
MIAIDAVQRTIILVKKFGLYAFVPVFLLIAYSYTNNTYKQYRVTAKISVKDISVAQAISDIHSEYLVKQTLDALPFQACYYDNGSPGTELYGSEVPVRMQFDGSRSMNAGDTWLQLEVSDDNSYSLSDQDTTAYHTFGQPVHESFGNFKMVRRPAGNHEQGTYTILLEDPSKQLETYYDNLKVAADDDNTVTLSTISGNPRKGAAFLDKLLEIYGGKSPDRHGDLVNSKFMLVEKPQDNFESITTSPIWFYILALLAGFAIPLGIPMLKKPRRNRLPSWAFTLPKLVDHVIQNGFVMKQAD